MLLLPVMTVKGEDRAGAIAQRDLETAQQTFASAKATLDNAKAQLANLWVPAVEIINEKGDPSYTNLGLRIFPDGNVEMIVSG